MKIPDITVKRETPLIFFGAGLVIVIIALVSFFPMTRSVRDDEYIGNLEKRLVLLEKRVADMAPALEAVKRLEISGDQIGRLSADYKELNEALDMRTRLLTGRVDGLQAQVMNMKNDAHLKRDDEPPKKKAVVDKPAPRSGGAAKVAVKPVEKKKEHVKKKEVVVYHVVKPGDTFYSISRKNGITLQKLKELNQFNAKTNIRPGQKVIVGP